LKLILQATPLPLEEPEKVTVIVEVSIDSVIAELDEADKGRLIFKLLAEALRADQKVHVSDVDWIREAHEKRVQAICDTAKAIRLIYRERWDWRTCGLSKEDAKLFGWDVPEELGLGTIAHVELDIPNDPSAYDEDREPAG